MGYSDGMKTAFMEDGSYTWNPEKAAGNTMWKYEQFRAGKVYAKFMFQTREEAETFASEMTKAQPDLFGRVEPVEARAIWN